MWLRSRQRQDFDLLILEIGTDHPGEPQQFSYLQPEIGVVTAVAPEHMEFFTSLAAVTKEELSIGSFYAKMVVNQDMVPTPLLKKYLPDNALLIGSKTAYNVSKPARGNVTLTFWPASAEKRKDAPSRRS